MRLTQSFRKMSVILLITALLTVLPACVGRNGSRVSQERDGTTATEEWQEDFALSSRELSDSGEATYFILEPGFQIVLASQKAKLTITVLDETKVINGVTTRIVEEREEVNEALYEISRNFFAIDEDTGDVFYFGEEVDFYENGEIVRHSGEWLAYEDGNSPGLIMPGTPAEGMRYYQEIAPGVAMDRAEVLTVSEVFETPAGEFENCLVTEESSPLEPGIKEYKTYAPGIGMIQDESLKLVSYGYLEGTTSQVENGIVPSPPGQQPVPLAASDRTLPC